MSLVQVSATVAFCLNGPGVQNDAFTVQNAGTSVLYFGVDHTVSATNYAYAVGPGTIVGWPADEACYVISDPTGEGSISYAPINISTNGNGGEISGTVSITPGSTVGIAGSVASNAANALVNLDQQNPVISAAAVIGGGVYSGEFNVTSYASLLVSLTTQFLAFTALVGNYLTVVINQFDETGAIVLSTLEPQFLLDEQMLCSIQVPVVGVSISISVIVQKAATAGPATLSIAVLGSHELLTEPRYISASETLVGAINVNNFYTNTEAVVGTSTQLVASINGDAIANCIASAGTSAGVFDILACTNGSTALLAQVKVTSGTTSGPISIKLPLLPIQTILQATTASLSASLVQ